MTLRLQLILVDFIGVVDSIVQKFAQKLLEKNF